MEQRRDGGGGGGDGLVGEGSVQEVHGDGDQEFHVEELVLGGEADVEIDVNMDAAVGPLPSQRSRWRCKAVFDNFLANYTELSQVDLLHGLVKRLKTTGASVPGFESDNRRRQYASSMSKRMVAYAVTKLWLQIESRPTFRHWVPLFVHDGLSELAKSLGR